MNQIQKTCHNCIWWNNINGSRGQCQRRAPSINENGHAAFPVTYWSDWCGEFEAKEAANSENQQP